MPKIPRLTSKEAEKMLLKNGFHLIRSKGSHRIYKKEDKRFILPILHPKIVKALLELLEK